MVLAGNVHLTDLVPQFAETLLPVFTTVLVTAPLGERIAGRHPLSRRGERHPSPGHHHRVVDGGRLMWSGRSSVWLGKPQRHANALLRQIRRTYPALRGVKAEYAWTGVTGHTVHGMPQIGEISPGLWLLGGFGGHGLNTTAMGGEMLARAIVEGDTDLADVLAVRAGLGRRPVRPRGEAGFRLVARSCEMIEACLARTRRDAQAPASRSRRGRRRGAPRRTGQLAGAGRSPVVPD